MKQIIYVDGTDIAIELPPKAKRLRMGDECKVDGETYEVWYIEEVGRTHVNVRVEKPEDVHAGTMKMLEGVGERFWESVQIAKEKK